MTWDDFLQSDELYRCLRAQDAFFNFFEGEVGWVFVWFGLRACRLGGAHSVGQAALTRF